MTDGESVSLQLSKTLYITLKLNKGDRLVNKVSIEKLRDEAIKKEIKSIVTVLSNNEDIVVLSVDLERTCLSIMVLIDKNKKWHE